MKRKDMRLGPSRAHKLRCAKYLTCVNHGEESLSMLKTDLLFPPCRPPLLPFRFDLERMNAR